MRSKGSWKIKKFIKCISIFFIGFLCGVILIIIIRNYQTPLVEVTIDNQSQLKLKKVIIRDDRLGNNYIVENLNQNNSEKIFLYANGEIGYDIIVQLENGDSLTTSAYAESGYKDLFVVKKDSIIYKPGIY